MDFSARNNLTKNAALSRSDTWPPLYTENMTFWAHSWRADYVDYLVESMLDQYHKIVEVAQVGQDRYFHHVSGRWAAERFAERLHRLLTE